MKRLSKKVRIAVVLAAFFVIPWLASTAFAASCVGDRAWNAARNRLNGTGNAVHADALYRSLLAFEAEYGSEAPPWPSRHGETPTEAITAAEVEDVRGPWGGFDHVIEALTCLEAVVDTVVVGQEQSSVEGIAEETVQEGWQTERSVGTSCPTTDDDEYAELVSYGVTCHVYGGEAYLTSEDDNTVQGDRTASLAHPAVDLTITDDDVAVVELYKKSFENWNPHPKTVVNKDGEEVPGGKYTSCNNQLAANKRGDRDNEGRLVRVNANCWGPSTTAWVVSVSKPIRTKQIQSKCSAWAQNDENIYIQVNPPHDKSGSSRFIEIPLTKTSGTHRIKDLNVVRCVDGSRRSEGPVCGVARFTTTEFYLTGVWAGGFSTNWIGADNNERIKTRFPAGVHNLCNP